MIVGILAVLSAIFLVTFFFQGYCALRLYFSDNPWNTWYAWYPARLNRGPSKGRWVFGHTIHRRASGDGDFVAGAGSMWDYKLAEEEGFEGAHRT